MTSVGDVTGTAVGDSAQRPQVAQASPDLASQGEGPASPTDLLSWSRVTTWLNCARAGYLKYIEQVPQRQGGAALGGKTVHSVIESWEKGDCPDPKYDFDMLWTDSLQEHDDIYWSGRKTRQHPNGEDADWWFENGPRMLDNYFAIRELDQEQGRRIVQGSNGPVVEAHVLMQIGGGDGSRPLGTGSSPAPASSGTGGGATPPPISWHGYLDAMMEDEHGLVVRDQKTGVQTDAKTVLQLASYAKAWTLTTGEIVERGEVVPLRKHKERIEYDLRPALEVIDTYYVNAARSIQAHIDADVFPAAPSNLCRGCSSRPFCPEGMALKFKEE